MSADGRDPKIQERRAETYAGIFRTATMDRLEATITEGLSDLFTWLKRHRLSATGSPFVRYHAVDMEGELELELAVPIASRLPGDDRVHAGTLPAGRWAVMLHVGPYAGLVAANARLQGWVEEHGLSFEMQSSRWVGRVERYLTESGNDSDPIHRRTEIAYLLAS
jgi:effector-binding domain-containing protein